MLFKETIRSWKGIGAPSATTVLLNTNRVGLLEADGSNSKFYYTMNPLDRRESAGYVLATTSAANVIVAMDDVLSSNAMALPIFPDDDVTASAVTKYIDYADFAYAVPHGTTPASYSWVYYYSKGFKKHRVLVDYNLDQLEDLAESGDTTTTTTV